MTRPASWQAERTVRDVQNTPYVAPLLRGADDAARRPYLTGHYRPNGLLAFYSQTGLF